MSPIDKIPDPNGGMWNIIGGIIIAIISTFGGKAWGSRKNTELKKAAKYSEKLQSQIEELKLLHKQYEARVVATKTTFKVVLRHMRRAAN